MKSIDDMTNSIYGDTIIGAIMKIDVIGRTSDGGYNLDLTLDCGSIIEVAVSEDKLKTINEKIFERTFFVVKPLDVPGRYESTCMVFGKAPEYVN